MLPTSDITVQGLTHMCGGGVGGQGRRSLVCQHQGCVAAGSGETGETFQYVQGFVARHRPRLLILENVLELTERVPCEQSDADHIIAWMQGVGYTAEYYIVEASLYGSFAKRSRIYFVGFMRSQAASIGFVRAVLHESQCPGLLEVGSFLMTDEDAADAIADVPPNGLRTAKKEPAYESEHEEIFLKNNWPWPLLEKTFVAEFQGEHMLSLPQRARELVFIVHKVYPMPDTVKVPSEIHPQIHTDLVWSIDYMHFISLSLSLPRLLSLSLSFSLSQRERERRRETERERRRES
jgi:hypothetical protein